MAVKSNFKVVCRLCGDESSELIRLHIRQPKQRNLKESIKKYLGIKVTPNDGLPDQICGPCIAKLDETSEFVDKCVMSQKLFVGVVSGINVTKFSDQEFSEIGTDDSSSSVEIKDEPPEGGEAALSAEQLLDTILQKDPSDSAEDDQQNSSDQSPDTERNFSIDDDLSNVDKNLMEVMLIEGTDEDDDSVKEEEQPVKNSVKLRKIKKGAHQCSQCPKSYSKERALKTHQRRVHEKSMEKCPKCEKVLSSNYLWQYHILIHSDERPHHCSECKKTFKTKHEATKHSRTHIPIQDRYNFSCEICGKRFTNKGNLTTHIKLHSDERPFVCDQCGKSFRHKGSLEDHQMGHKGEKTFICTVCGKGFFRVQALAVHERCHTGSRPFYCSHCGKGFRSTKVLKRHELIHTDARPYPCQFCGKGFRDHGKRKVHERIHTGERPYECSLCPVAFYESGNLKKHLQKVHKQPKSIHIRLQKGEDETVEDKVDYETPFHNPEHEMEQPREDHMQPNPLLGHSIFTNPSNMGFMPPTHQGPYHIL